ncbi:MAG: hypothetical protein ACTTJZ_04985 [Sphaerochaetaceae bacterium]
MSKTILLITAMLACSAAGLCAGALELQVSPLPAKTVIHGHLDDGKVSVSGDLTLSSRLGGTFSVSGFPSIKADGWILGSYEPAGELRLLLDRFRGGVGQGEGKCAKPGNGLCGFFFQTGSRLSDCTPAGKRTAGLWDAMPPQMNIAVFHSTPALDPKAPLASGFVIQTPSIIIALADAQPSAVSSAEGRESLKLDWIARPQSVMTLHALAGLRNESFAIIAAGSFNRRSGPGLTIWWRIAACGFKIERRFSKPGPSVLRPSASIDPISTTELKAHLADSTTSLECTWSMKRHESPRFYSDCQALEASWVFKLESGDICLESRIKYAIADDGGKSTASLIRLQIRRKGFTLAVGAEDFKPFLTFGDRIADVKLTVEGISFSMKLESHLRDWKLGITVNQDRRLRVIASY